jgi:hypothetical protein
MSLSVGSHQVLAVFEGKGTLSSSVSSQMTVTIT